MLYAIGVHERLGISNTASSRDGLQCALCNWDKDPKPLHKSGPPHTHHSNCIQQIETLKSVKLQGTTAVCVCVCYRVRQSKTAHVVRLDTEIRHMSAHDSQWLHSTHTYIYTHPMHCIPSKAHSHQRCLHLTQCLSVHCDSEVQCLSVHQEGMAGGGVHEETLDLRQETSWDPRYFSTSDVGVLRQSCAHTQGLG